MRFDHPNDAVYAMWRLRSSLSAPRGPDQEECVTAGEVCERCAYKRKRRSRKGTWMCAGCHRPWVGVKKGFPKAPVKTYARPADYDRGLVALATLEVLVAKIPDPERRVYLHYLSPDGGSFERVAGQLTRIAEARSRLQQFGFAVPEWLAEPPEVAGITRFTRYQVETWVQTAQDLLQLRLRLAGLVDEDAA